MRRPSAIPASAPPVEHEGSTGAGGESERLGRGQSPVPVDGVAAVRPSRTDPAGSVPERSDPPIAFESRRSPDSAAIADGDGEPDAESPVGSALTARDLWQATRARRRALRSEIRRFTQRSRRRRIAWVVGAALTLLVVGGSVGAAYSPLFAVQTITVEGASAIKPADVQQALAAQVGRPLALVDSSAVKAALVRFPLIETYRLEAHPPHDLVVRIVERTPVGVIQQSDGRFTVVDAAGVVLSTSETQPAGYALIEVAGGTDTAAFAAAGTALRTLPAELRAQVGGVTASTPDDIVLKLTSGATVTWGSADQSAEKTLVLQRLMGVNPGATSFDVSSPGVAIAG